MKTSMSVKEQKATSKRSKTFNIVIGYFWKGQLDDQAKSLRGTHFAVCYPSRRHLRYHHAIDDDLQYMPGKWWAVAFV